MSAVGHLQNVRLFELLPLVDHVGPRVHPVVDLQQPLGALLLGHLHHRFYVTF